MFSVQDKGTSQVPSMATDAFHWPCRQEIIDTLVPNATMLAGQKFASNVLETCLQVGSQAQKDQVTRAITELPARDSDVLPAARVGQGEPLQECMSAPS